MMDVRGVVVAGFIEQVRAGQVAKTLAQVDQPVEAANGQGEHVQVGGEAVRQGFDGEVVAARKDDDRFLALGQDEIVKQKCPCPCAIEFLRHPGSYPHLGDLHQPGGEQHLDMVLDPGRVFAKLPAKLGESGRRVHQPAQDGHAPRVGEKFDLFKGIQGFDSVHN